MKNVLIAVLAVASIATADIYVTTTAGYGVSADGGASGLLGANDTALIQFIYAGTDGDIDATAAGIGGQLITSDLEELVIGTQTFTASADPESDYSAYLTGYTYNLRSSAQNGGAIFVRVFADENAASGSKYYESALFTAGDSTVGTPPGPPTDTFDFAATASAQGTQTVVPEPATIGLLGIAGAGLFAARRKTQA